MAITNWLLTILFLLSVGASYWLSRWVTLRWWPSLAYRVGILLLVLVAAATGVNEYNAEPVYPREVLVLDQSDSVVQGSDFQPISFALAWKDLRPNRNVVLFGADVDYMLSENWPEVLSAGSNLAGALGAAQNLLGAEKGRILIASDGNVTDILQVNAALEQLSAEGIAVEYLPLNSISYKNDVFVRQVVSASTVWEDNRFPIAVQYHSPLETQALMQVYLNGVLFTERKVLLSPGEGQEILWMKAGSSGIMSLEVVLVLEGDSYPANNVGYRSLLVYESPDVLLVTQTRPAVRDLVNDLQAENATVTIISPEDIPTNLDTLSEYEVILIHDILARDISLEQMRALEIHVLENGRSLVFLGGRNSFTLGGYTGTPMEAMLPVVLAPPERIERVPVTFVLVLDRSGSMQGDISSSISPIGLTREAAMRALETLRPDDYFGVLTFSGQTNWEVDIQLLEDGVNLRLAQDKVSQIIAGGGTLMYQALDEAIQALSSMVTTDHLHILLMSDGKSGDGSQDEFRSLVQAARSRDISISTIALGNESDPETLSLIAEEGNGRYYLVLNANELPNVMISETRAVQSENVQEGETNLLLGVDNHPVLAGFQLDKLPRMNAYIALQSKANRGAEDILVSGNFGDPVLSIWQLGLGHVAVWTGDLGEIWMPGLTSWEDQGTFWMQLFRYSLPNPSFGKSEVRFKEENQNLSVELAIQDLAGLARQNLKPVFTFNAVGTEAKSYLMTKTAPGKYAVTIPRPAPGAYQGAIRYAVGGKVEERLVPFALDYPEEWRFSDPQYQATDYVVLKNLFSASDLSMEQELNTDTEFSEDGGFSWTSLVLFLVLLSWPAEIAIRRWKMPWRRP